MKNAFGVALAIVAAWIGLYLLGAISPLMFIGSAAFIITVAVLAPRWREHS